MIEQISHFFHFKFVSNDIMVGKCEISNTLLQFIEISILTIDKFDFWHNSELKQIQSGLELKKKEEIVSWTISNVFYKIAVVHFLHKIHADVQIEPKNIVITKNPNGKPIINFDLEKNPHYYSQIPYIHISISHSEQFLMIAVGLLPIGIDCEVIKELSIELKKKVLNIEELNLINIEYEKEKKILTKCKGLFFWCIKEATMKCIGSLRIGEISNIRIKIETENYITYWNEKRFRCLKYSVDQCLLWVIVFEEKNSFTQNTSESLKVT